MVSNVTVSSWNTQGISAKKEGSTSYLDEMRANNGEHGMWLESSGKPDDELLWHST